MNMTVPSGFYESLNGLQPFHVSAVCAGLRRSGSTMLYQIVRDCFPEGGVIKTHSFLDVPDSVPVIVTVRHLLDAAVSWWRVTRYDAAERNAREVARILCERNFWATCAVNWAGQRRDRVSHEEAVELATLIKRDLSHMEQYRAAGKRILVLRYDDFWDKPAAIREILAAHIGRTVSEATIASHSLDANKTLRRFTDKPDQHFAPNYERPTSADAPHCFDGKPGVWRGCCEDDFLFGLLKDEMARYNYQP